MDENVVFRTAAVGGFEKKAVLDYIRETNEKFRNEKTTLLQQLKDLESTYKEQYDEVQGFSSKFQELENEISDVSEKLASEKDENKEIKEGKKKLEDEIKKLNLKLEEKEQAYKKDVEKNQAFADKSKDLEAQKEEIDKVSAQLGRVMLDARADADIIVSNAEEQAKGVILDAEKEAADINIKAKNKVDQLLISVKDTVMVELETATTEAEKIITEADLIAKTTISTADSRAAEVLGGARDRVAEISNAAKVVTSSTQSDLMGIRRESLAVHQALQEVLVTLQEKSKNLDTTIEKALETLDKQDILASSQNLLTMPQLNIEDVLSRVEAQKEEIRQEIIDAQKLDGDNQGLDDEDLSSDFVGEDTKEKEELSGAVQSENNAGVQEGVEPEDKDLNTPDNLKTETELLEKEELHLEGSKEKEKTFEEKFSIKRNTEENVQLELETEIDKEITTGAFVSVDSEDIVGSQSELLEKEEKGKNASQKEVVGEVEKLLPGLVGQKEEERPAKGGFF